MKPTAVRMRIKGLVHGVMFRASMARFASDLGVHGWVRNMTDGSVEAFLEGEEHRVLEVVDWARRGPPRARVDRLDVVKAAPRKYHGFRIEG